MRITPLDVRKQEFRRVVRGVDADEVHAFLATVADEYEAVLTDNKHLREKVMELDEKVGEYRTMERTLRDTLLTAERVMTEARQNARKEAELILRDAQLRASQATNNIEQRVDALRAQIRELRGQRDAFLARMQSLAEAQVGLVSSYRKDFNGDDERSERLMRDPGATQPEPPRSHAPVTGPAEPAPAASAPASSIFDLVDEPAGPARETNTADNWKGYELGRAASGPVHPVGPASGAVPRFQEDDEVHGAVEHVLSIHEDTTQRITLADDLFEAGPPAHEDGASGQWTPPVPTYSGPEPIDPERMQAEAAGGEVPTTSASQAADGSNQPAEEHSRWSLSRFTRGLAGL
jgi:cell division initiation protein